MKFVHWIPLACVVGVMVGGLFACSPETPNKSDQAATASSSSLGPPPRINSFWMRNLLSEFPSEIRTSDYAGQIQLIIFWSPTDPVATRTFMRYETLPCVVLGVVVDSRDPARIEADIRALPLASAPVGLGTPDILSAFGVIRVYPTSFLVDTRGKVVRVYAGHEPMTMILDDIHALQENRPLPERVSVWEERVE